MSKKTDRGLVARLEALYARLPAIDCRRLCGAACGPIPLSRLEADRLRRATHTTPRTVGTTCGYLTARGTCSAYAVRPLICRVYGLVKAMSCPHGCMPARWLDDREFLALAAEVERLGGPMLLLTPDGPADLVDGFVRLEHDVAISDARGETLPDDVRARCAEVTRGLRALHGGRIIGVRPNERPEWIDLEELRRRE